MESGRRPIHASRQGFFPPCNPTSGPVAAEEQSVIRKGVASADAVVSPFPFSLAHVSASNSTQQGFRRGLERIRSPDLPLDAFDKELLSLEPAGDRQYKTSRGFERLSLPARATLPPRSSQNVPTEIRQDSFITPDLRHPQGSSPSTVVGSSADVLNVNSRRGQSPDTVIEPSSASRSLPQGSRKTNDQSRVSTQRPMPSATIQLGHAPPIVQGIPLVSLNNMTDRYRSLFPFPFFNAVQSRCFETAFGTDENLVLSAPTGSGKTVIMELAICRLISSVRSGDFKIVYQAPTKALCSERCNDWQAKFGPLDLQCAELTGETDASQMRHVQTASIIVTTPEKWDSVTRRWKDHVKLMRLVKLFLIDEVHILKENRGATLEAVVSRMKSTGYSVRFIALSATVPNPQDVAVWLGKDSTHPYLPAHQEAFGEEFRPVQLQKVVYGYPVKTNDFAFDSLLETKLPEIIAKQSRRKPILIFCPFRRSCVKTAKALAQLWMSTMPSERLWSAPSREPHIQDPDLRHCSTAGVAFHHAGLDAPDRRAVEQAFLSHNINVICCTSTLAVGVNLPCFLVIIKGTKSWTDSGLQEYADLEMVQMLGRAGRPQFEQTACAVILCRNDRVDHYEKLVSGQEPLESCLHLNLIDHLNAEVGLGTVTDLPSAKRWLASTFLHVRLSQNPAHYRLKEDVTSRNDAQLLDQICAKDLALLQEADLVKQEEPLSCTEFGDAMTRYYVKFDSMQIFMSLPPQAKASEILSAIAQAADFRDIRLKPGEKSLYKQVNKDLGIKFPIKVDLALSAHKVSLLLQAELGGLEFPLGEQFAKHRGQFQQDKNMVFQHVNRLIRCIIDCQLSLEDSVSARHALELARSFAARVWDNSPLQLKQLDQIGNVAVRKLANANITSIEELENTQAQRIEAVIGRGPPFGMKLLSTVAQFPKLRVLVKATGNHTRTRESVEVKLKAEIGFLNEKVPLFFHRKPVYVCFLAEVSNGKIIDFRRIAASKLQNGHDVFLTAALTKPSQYVSCYVMCDEIAGTCRFAELKHDLPASLFSNLSRPEASRGAAGADAAKDADGGGSHKSRQKRKRSDDFDEGEIEDNDLLAAESAKIMEIDCFEETATPSKLVVDRETPREKHAGAGTGQHSQLDNGNWQCNHRCKDKTKCKHLCCREGLDRPPKIPKKSSLGRVEGKDNVASVESTVNRPPSADQTSHATAKVNSTPQEPSCGQRLVVPKINVSKARRLPNTDNENRETEVTAELSSAHQPAVEARSVLDLDDCPIDETANDSEWSYPMVEGAGGLANKLEDEDVAASASKAGEEDGMTATEQNVVDDEFGFDDSDLAFLEQHSEHRRTERNVTESHPYAWAINRKAPGSGGMEEGVGDNARGDYGGGHEVDGLGSKELDPHAHTHDGNLRSRHFEGTRLTRQKNKAFDKDLLDAKITTRSLPDQGPPTQPATDDDLSQKVKDIPRSASRATDCKNLGPVFNLPAQGVPKASLKTTAPKQDIEETSVDQQLLKYGIDPAFYDEFKDFVEFV